MKPRVNPKERMLDNILLYFSDRFFSQSEAARIVGGMKKLMRLIERGEIDADKPTCSQNGKWRCRADQVLRHCRLMHPSLAATASLHSETECN